MNKTLLLAAAAFAASLTAQDPSAPAPMPAPTNWKDLTRYGLPIKFYGFFRLDAYYNTARMDSVVIPTRMLSETKRNDDQFHMDPRLTRFGFDVTPEPIGGCQVWGKLEIDFANFPTGSAESRATPRVRVAWIDVAQDEWGLRVGQDWDVISPLMPAVNSEMLMWNAGNLGDRRAQIQGRYAPKDGKFDLKAALGLTGAVNNQDLDTGAAAGERDGFDSGMPNLEVRAGMKPFAIVEKKPVELGAWALYGRTETDTFFNGENRFDEWAVGMDFQVPIADAFTFRGEVWTGENLGDVRGGVGQTINTTLGREIASSGGWGEVVYAATSKTRFHVGGTIDDPKNEDLSATNPKRNLSGYAGTSTQWESGLKTGFDAIYWQTEYVGALDGNGIRFDLWFQFDF